MPVKRDVKIEREWGLQIARRMRYREGFLERIARQWDDAFAIKCDRHSDPDCAALQGSPLCLISEDEMDTMRTLAKTEIYGIPTFFTKSCRLWPLPLTGINVLFTDHDDGNTTAVAICSSPPEDDQKTNIATITRDVTRGE